MKVVSKFRIYTGIFIFFILALGYFLRIEVDSGANYTVKDTLLGIMIFHNLLVFVVYLLVALFFIFTGFRKVKVV